MFIIGNLLEGLAVVLNIILSVYMWIVIIAALLSWVNPDPYNPIVRFLYSVTEPVLRQVRRYIPLSMGIDFSPLIVILVIIFLKKFLIASMFEIAMRLR